MISLDGNPCFQLLDSRRTKVSFATWVYNGKAINIISSYSFPGKPDQIEYTLSQIWSLASVDKEMRVTLTSPNYSINAVYNKR